MGVVKNTDYSDTHAQVFEHLKHIVPADLEGIRKENVELKEKLVWRNAEFEKMKSDLTLRLKEEHERLVDERTSCLQTSIVNLEQQLHASTQALELSMVTNRNMLAENKELQQEKSRLTERLMDVERVKTSNESGIENEQKTLSILQNGGLFVRDTSKGAHNLHYHDKLVAKKFLHKNEGRGTPTYRTDANSVVLSFEDKCYKHSNKLGEEIERFYEIRAGMQVGGRADCFVWYSTATIPIKQHKRKYIEYDQLEDGRFCVTGWIGAPDVSAEELVRFVNEVIEQQECLMTLKTKLPVESETIQRLTTSTEHAIKLVKKQLEQVDRLTGHIKDLEQQRDSIRLTALEMIFRHYATLKEVNLLSTNDHVVNDSLMSLTNEKRTEADKIIRNKDEFSHLQGILTGRCSTVKKRKSS